MELKTSYKKVNLVFTTRKIVNISNILDGKNFEELYFKAMNENDAEALAQIILVFSEDDAGLSSFKTIDEVYDFIDDYKEENKKSYGDIYTEIAGAINDEGFFKSKMTKEQLTERISNPISSINMTEIIKNSAEKAIGDLAQAEIKAQA